MDTQELNKRYGEFSNDVWSHFLGSEHSTNRKYATFMKWLERSRVARHAMRDYLAEHSAPKSNPFFWVKRFPEPVPTNYNGKNKIPTDQELFIAVYNGEAGIYTRQDVEDYKMTIKKRFTL